MGCAGSKADGGAAVPSQAPPSPAPRNTADNVTQQSQQVDGAITALLDEIGMTGAARENVMRMSLEQKQKMLETRASQVTASRQKSVSREITPRKEDSGRNINAASPVSLGVGTRKLPSEYIAELTETQHRGTTRLLTALRVELSSAPRDWMCTFYQEKGLETLAAAVFANMDDVHSLKLCVDSALEAITGTLTTDKGLHIVMDTPVIVEALVYAYGECTRSSLELDSARRPADGIPFRRPKTDGSVVEAERLRYMIRAACLKVLTVLANMSDDGLSLVVDSLDNYDTTTGITRRFGVLAASMNMQLIPECTTLLVEYWNCKAMAMTFINQLLFNAASLEDRCAARMELGMAGLDDAINLLPPIIEDAIATFGKFGDMDQSGDISPILQSLRALQRALAEFMEMAEGDAEETGKLSGGVNLTSPKDICEATLKNAADTGNFEGAMSVINHLLVFSLRAASQADPTVMWGSLEQSLRVALANKSSELTFEFTSSAAQQMQQIQDLKRRLLQSESELTTLKQEAAKLSATASERELVQGKVAELTAKIKELQQEITTAKKNEGAALEAMQTAETRANEYSEKLSKQEAALDDLQKRFDAAAEALSRMESENKELARQMASGPIVETPAEVPNVMPTRQVAQPSAPVALRPPAPFLAGIVGARPSPGSAPSIPQPASETGAPRPARPPAAFLAGIVAARPGAVDGGSAPRPARPTGPSTSGPARPPRPADFTPNTPVRPAELPPTQVLVPTAEGAGSMPVKVGPRAPMAPAGGPGLPMPARPDGAARPSGPVPGARPAMGPGGARPGRPVPATGAGEEAAAHATNAVVSGKPPKTTVKPSIKVKGLFWTKLPDKSVDNSIFKDITDDDVKLDVDELQTTFRAVAGAPVKSATDAPKAAAKPKGPVLIITGKRQQNISIALARLRLRPNEIRQAVLQCDLGMLAADKLELLREMVPTAEELQAVRDYEGPVQDLGGVEQLFLAVGSVPRYEQRLISMLFSHKFDGVSKDASEKLILLQAAIESVRASVALKTLLKYVLAIGNFLNGESAARGGAYGFKMDTLKKLATIQAAEGKQSLVDFIARVARKDPKAAPIANLPTELAAVSKARGESLDAITNEVKNVDIAFQQAVRLCADLGAGTRLDGDCFDTAMQVALTSIKPRINQLSDQCAAVNAAYKQLLGLFCEDQTDTTSWLTGLHDVMMDFKKALDAVKPNPAAAPESAAAVLPSETKSTAPGAAGNLLDSLYGQIAAGADGHRHAPSAGGSKRLLTIDEVPGDKSTRKTPMRTLRRNPSTVPPEVLASAKRPHVPRPPVHMTTLKPGDVGMLKMHSPS